MSRTPHAFSRNAARRIVRATRTVEGMEITPFGPRPDQRHRRGQRRWKGKTAAAISKGSSGDVDVYSGQKGSEAKVDGLTIEAYNTYADVAVDTWVAIEWIDGGWELYVAECADELISSMAGATLGTGATSTASAVAVYDGVAGQTYQVSAGNLLANVMSDQIVLDGSDNLVTANGNVVVAGG